MKQLFLSLLCLLLLTPVYAVQFAKNVNLNIEFDSQPNPYFYQKPLHFNTNMQIDPHQHTSTIVSTQSEMIGRLPATVLLLVKSSRVSDDEIVLRFSLIHYSFTRAGTIIAQPKVVLKNGQQVEMMADKFKLKVMANWG